MNSDIEAKRIEQILNQSKAKEKKFTFLSLTFVVLILTLTTGWLLYTAKQVTRLSQKKNELEIQKNNLEKEIILLKNKLDSSSLVLKNVIDVDLHAAKYLYGENTCVAKVLSRILEMKGNTRFDYNNRNGMYNSPAFIGYVLHQFGILPSAPQTSKQLQDQMISVNSPRMGDIIIYRSGYSMLYVNRVPALNGEFCIGMTPWGILAFKTDFAPIVAIKRPSYPANCR